MLRSMQITLRKIGVMRNFLSLRKNGVMRNFLSLRKNGVLRYFHNNWHDACLNHSVVLYSIT
jgi:hypothetical protein